MSNFLKILFVLFFVFSCKQNPRSNTVLEIPKEYRFENKTGYVNDFDGILSQDEEIKLEKLFSDYDKISSNEIGVVTIKSIKPFSDINIFGDKILENWRFGKDDKFNGLLFVINKNQRQIAIRFGSGIQKKITNSETQKILNELILPKFKEKKYYDGIKLGFETLQQKLE